MLVVLCTSLARIQGHSNFFVMIHSALLWLRRIRHRRGYGIHSPWLFGLVVGVIYESEAYYAYSALRPVDGWRLKDLRLLLRLANHFQPERITLCGVSKELGAWLHAGCRHAIVTYQASQQPFILMQRPNGQQCIITHGCHSALWKELQREGVTLDLFYIGLAYRGISIPSQHHIINYT